MSTTLGRRAGRCREQIGQNHRWSILDRVIRRATLADLDELAGVHLAAFRAGNGPYVDPGALSELTYERNVERWRPVIAHPPSGAAVQVDVDGRIIGLCSAGACRDEDGAGLGQLYAIYVDPQRWGDGTAVALEEAARAHLRNGHFTEATLWTLAANTRARRFYEKRGWRQDGSTMELMGATCVRYRTELR
jgi:GNAT superfamily N-acetyltransferase